MNHSVDYLIKKASKKSNLYFLRRVVAFVVFLSQSIYIQAQTTNSHNIILPDIDELILEKQFVFSEKEIKVDISHAIQHETIFELKQSHYVNNGVFNKSHWLKLNLINQSENSKFVFEFNNHYVDTIWVFAVRDQSVIKSFSKQGLYFQNDSVSSPLTNKYGYEYEISIPRNDTISLYINAIVNDGPFRVINKLYTKKGYENRKEEVRLRTTYLLLLLGFIALVVIFSLGMFAFTRRRIYLYYFGFVTSITLNIICVNHFLSPVLIERYLLFGNNYTEMLSYLQVFFILLYANDFLSIKQSYTKIYKLIWSIAIVNMVVFILGLYLRQYDFYYAFSFYFSKIVLTIITLFIYSFAIYLVKKENLMAKYFVIAYTPLVGFVVYIIMQSLNLVSFSNPFNWELITFFEIVVLSMAMVHQFFLIIKENSNYQKIIKSKGQESKHIRLKSKAVLSVDKLMFVKSDTHYLEFHLADRNKPEIDRNTFKEIEQTLPQSKFLRVHRSYLVNMDYVKIINSDKIMLENEQWINVSRTYKSKLKEMVESGIRN